MLYLVSIYKRRLLWRFYMITCFVQLNLKLLFVLILLGFIIGKSRHSAIQNFSNKKCGYFIMDFFNLIGIPVHELGHLLFGLFFGYHIDQVCLYPHYKKGDSFRWNFRICKNAPWKSFLFAKTAGRFRAVFYLDWSTVVWTSRYLYYQPVSPGKYQNTPFSFQKGWAISLKALQQLRASDIIFLFVFLYIIMGISLNMELSRQDMHLACKGLILLEVIFLILSGLSVLFHWNLQYSIDILFRWNLLISSIGIISALIANLISLI